MGLCGGVYGGGGALHRVVRFRRLQQSAQFGAGKADASPRTEIGQAGAAGKTVFYLGEAFLYSQGYPAQHLILRDEENGWYAIDFEGHIRYVHGDYITTDQNEVNGYTASSWDGPVLTASAGTINGPSGKETYYNLNMSGVVSIMRSLGNTDEYWVRDDGAKMLGNYVMVAANLNVHPRGSIVETSLGLGIVCDTGGFASGNSTQLDIAVSW